MHYVEASNSKYPYIALVILGAYESTLELLDITYTNKAMFSGSRALSHVTNVEIPHMNGT